MSDEQPIQLPLTEEQQELIHRLTGEHANVLELALGKGDGSSGTGRRDQLQLAHLGRLGDSQQRWKFGLPKRPAPDPGGSA